MCARAQTHTHTHTHTHTLTHTFTNTVNKPNEPTEFKLDILFNIIIKTFFLTIELVTSYPIIWQISVLDDFIHSRKNKNHCQ